MEESREWESSERAPDLLFGGVAEDSHELGHVLGRIKRLGHLEAFLAAPLVRGTRRILSLHVGL